MTMSLTTLEDRATVTVRALAREDLDAVVAIDTAIEGRARRSYVERRLAAALREPALHAQFAALSGTHGLIGYILARVLAGEFGHSEPVLRLEMVGVSSPWRHQGAGQQLFDALAGWARRHGIGEARTVASWRDSAMLPWLAHLGFAQAPQLVLGRTVGAGDGRVAGEDLTLPGAQEVDFGSPEDNDHERLARGRPDVRPMQQADLREIVRIDRSITGRDRSTYIGARLAETMAASGLRVSLTARLDGAIVGFLMARADLGDFGRIEPVAVIDTLGVDRAYTQRGVGHALLAQLDAQLAALHIEQIETVVALADLPLLGFFVQAGFAPTQRLAFVRRLDATP
jgi:predicted N-acetyltransferase YhbS